MYSGRGEPRAFFPSAGRSGVIPMKVTVVGGGISGLATAHYLARLSGERGVSLSVEVVESSPRLGGKIQTHRIDGFLVESGPNGFLTNRDSTLRLCSELGVEEELYPSSDSARRRYIARGGRLYKVPENAKEFFSTPLLSLRGKLRLLLEPFIPAVRGNEGESLYDFAVRRLGREAAERLIEPMAAGVFAGNPKEMNLKCSFPKIYRLENRYGGLFKGMLALRRERKNSAGGGPAGPGGKLYSLRQGMESLIKFLQNNENISVKLNSSLLSLERNGGGFRLYLRGGEGEFVQDSDVVILSAPAFSIAEVLAGSFSQLAELFLQIRYAPLAVVSAGLELTEELAKKLDAFGFLVPALEGGNILGVLYDSSIFSNRAPEGKALIRIMMGGMRSPELLEKGDEELISLALGDFFRYLGTEFQPEFVRVFRHSRAIPQYDLGHPHRVREIEKLRPSGLFFCTNCLYGVGVNDCTANALKTAEEVLAYISKGVGF